MIERYNELIDVLFDTYKSPTRESFERMKESIGTFATYELSSGFREEFMKNMKILNDEYFGNILKLDEIRIDVGSMIVEGTNPPWIKYIINMKDVRLNRDQFKQYIIEEYTLPTIKRRLDNILNGKMNMISL